MFTYKLFMFEIQKCGQVLCAHKPYFLMLGHISSSPHHHHQHPASSSISSKIIIIIVINITILLSSTSSNSIVVIVIVNITSSAYSNYAFKAGPNIGTILYTQIPLSYNCYNYRLSYVYFNNFYH